MEHAITELYHVSNHDMVWTRIAAANGGDFASTPGGTAYFFFAQFHGHALKPFSIFMAVASAINFVWFVYVLIPAPREIPFPEGNKNEDQLSAYLNGIVWFPLFVIFWLPSMIITLSQNFLMAAFIPCASGLGWLLGIFYRPIKVNREAGISRVPTFESEIVRRSSFEPNTSVMIKYVTLSSLGLWPFTDGLCIRFRVFVPLLIAIWRIIAIELILRWNLISQVYDIRSAGQIIPLVTGTSGLLDTLSKKEIFAGKTEREHTGENTSSNTSDVAQQTSSPSGPPSPSAPSSPRQTSMDSPHEGVTD